MEAGTEKRRFTKIEYALILLTFSLCLAGALLLPVNQCPDETGRDYLITWMLERGTLPTGDELETIVPDPPPAENYGFSYALRPYLAAIVGALFVRMTALFTDSPRLLLAASRMCGVLSVTLCCFFCLRLGHRLFERRACAVLFAAFVCFLPQVMFLGMYHNNDSLALFAVSMMLYYLAEGYERKWPIKSCVGLAVAFSVGLLSYYSIYGWILAGALFFVVSVMTDRGLADRGALILKRTGLIALICLLLAGWFFIRSAILHGGDFLGIAYEKLSRERVEALGYKLCPLDSYRSECLTMLEFFRLKNYEWLRMTGTSFVGVFGVMTIYLTSFLYRVYYFVFGFGILLFAAALRRRRLGRRDGLLLLMMVLSVGINFALHFWHSYARDYQPQGRYIISAAFLLGYMLAYGMDHIALPGRNAGEGKRALPHPAAVLTLLWLLLFAWVCLGTMTKMLL